MTRLSTYSRPYEPLALCLIVLLLLWYGFAVAADELTASVDRTHIAADESLTLTLRYQGQTPNDPDFSDLERDFDILSNQRLNQFAFTNGSSESYTQWTLNLIPKHSGKLIIPSFHLSGAVSDALEIDVADASASNNTNPDKPLFAEAELSSDSAYIQQQVLLTYRLYTSMMLSDLGMSDIDIPGADVVKIDDSQYQKTINGRSYTVVELRYALFPQQPGTVDIPPVRFTGLVPDQRNPFGRSFFSQLGKRIALDTRRLTLTAKPKPDHASSPWLPSQGLSIAQRWSRPPEDLVVGEPITRSLIISAQGLRGAQLPPLPGNIGSDFKTYPDQPQIEDKLVDSGVVGTRIESQAIVPTRAGTLTLPAIELHWWDTVSGQQRTARLEPVTVHVAPAANTGNTPTASSPPMVSTSDGEQKAENLAPGNTTTNTIVWVLALLNLLLLLLALTFAALWWRNRGRTAATNNIDADTSETRVEKSSFTALRALLLSSDPNSLGKIRHSILHWAALWTGKPLTTLAAFGTHCGDPQLTALFKRLDQVVYSRQSTDEFSAADRQQLLEQLEKLRKNRPFSQKASHSPRLEPLYPA